jgi:hypothetical protein
LPNQEEEPPLLSLRNAQDLLIPSYPNGGRQSSQRSLSLQPSQVQGPLTSLPLPFFVSIAFNSSSNFYHRDTSDWPSLAGSLVSPRASHVDFWNRNWRHWTTRKTSFIRNPYQNWTGIVSLIVRRSRVLSHVTLPHKFN